ncbi:HD domain-containing protein [Rhodococcoides kroppenstedtii]|uniref:HD domain-containing protein n=1 Tax=Rhodococcoides kroppenstedtii TaxID=293050 RepID=UPI0036423031
MTTSTPSTPTSTHELLLTALRATALKDMDPSLLLHAIDIEADARGIDRTDLDHALAVASYAHLEQRRTQRGDQVADPYITHPSRNTLRLLRYGCTDQAVLVATALHDVVEDQPDRVVSLLGGSDAAPDALRRHFGDDVADLVAAVTNPQRDPARDKAEQYAEHVTAAIADRRVFLVKLTDFVDNAGSLKYLADDAKRLKLAAKYAPLVPIFVRAADDHRHELGLPPEGLSAIENHLHSIAEQTRS